MSKSPNFRVERNTNSRSSRRRAQGVSRRQRRQQLGFETLEDRRVMSAESPLAALQAAVANDVQFEVSSLSSSTAEGQAQIWLNELYWQSLLASSQNLAAASRSIPSDPLVGDQWHLLNDGQQVGNPDFQNIFAIAGEDINVAPVWNQDIFGNGVVVGVFEPGGFFETTHPDLEANLHPTLSFDAVGSSAASGHATSVTGLIGAVADNSTGGTGVAPGVTLVPMGGAGFSALSNALAFRFATNNGVDIVNNSWGPSDNVRSIDGPTAAEILALRDSVIFGRDGLGVINVWASGNGAGTPFDFPFTPQGIWDSAAYDGYVNSRYTIGVTGVDHDGFYNNVDGTVTGYPETSTSVLVAAPTGSVFYDIADDTGIGSGIVTTDLTGENGSNVTGFVLDRDFLEDIDYTSRFNGTSASAPIVSGVIALMLEANPNLSWRDVQEILVRSARQNAEFEVPIAAGVGTTQNTWIQNQMPVFHDPDLWDPTINPFTQTAFPTLDPALSDAGFNSGPGPIPNLVGQFLNSSGSTGAHYQPTPPGLINGAGYTVSQGKGVHGEMIGYGHGVVDAELAVQLAQQWHTKNQALPNELTFTSFINPSGGFFINVPAAEVSDDDSGNQLVPGGLGGDAGFVGFWNEYFVDDPFNNNPLFPNRGGYVELSVPDNNLMTIENIDVKISLTGDSDVTEFMNNMRVTLISPTGTHHEFNHFFGEFDGTRFRQTFDFNGYGFEENPALISVDNDPDNPGAITFSSNRSWGERSDNAIIFDPTTAEPANTSGNGLHGWQLHFENYSQGSAIGVTGIEVVWHGSPINQAGTQRVQGLVGVDDNQDDLFNFNRTTVVNSDTDGVVRLGEVTSVINSHESMGANVTVFAHRDSNGNGVLDASDVLVDQFVTGADGNYYFDLVPDRYIFSVDDAAGRTAVDDTLTPAGFLNNFQSEWLVTPDFFRVWNYDAALEVPLDPATDAPFTFPGITTPYHVNHINFLLDPGAPPAPQVSFSGSVFADINGDGVFNGSDVAVPGVGVFGDVNRNGALDAGEILTTTDATGAYLLTVPSNIARVINVGVRPPANWTPSDPAAGFESFFVEPGDAIADVDFDIMPPAGTTSGDGSVLSGIILGAAFNDSNGDGIRQNEEVGVPNQTVYVDMNNSGAIDAGDIVTLTNSNGAYAFADLPDDTFFLRIDLAPDSPLTQTFPILGLPQAAIISAGGTATDINFGINSGTTGGVLDFGDLPDVYGTRLVDDGARHPAGIFYLGGLIDSEANGQPTADATGDDVLGFPDEDGVVLVSGSLVPGLTGTLQVSASRHTGFLQGWMDFNNDGDFADTIGGISEQIVVNDLLNAGANTITFDIPATIVGTTVYARFRYGEYGLGPKGLALTGEVEDYAYAVTPPGPADALGPDFDNDGDVDGADFFAWQRGFGVAAPTLASGDANNDGQVNAADLGILLTDYGQLGPVAVQAAVAADGSEPESGTDSEPAAAQIGVDEPLVEALATAASSDTGSGASVFSALLRIPQSPEELLAPSGSRQTTSMTTDLGTADLGPRMTQPGFREDLEELEDLVAGVVDTGGLVSAVDRLSVASLASGVERLTLPGMHGTRRVARVEQSHQGHQGHQGHHGQLQQLLPAARSEFGLAARDRALDQIFARRSKAPEEIVRQRFDADEAFAQALGEEIDWRLS